MLLMWILLHRLMEAGISRQTLAIYTGMEKWMVLIKNKLFQWLTGFVRLLPNLAMAVLVFVTFFFLAKWIRKFSNKLFLRISDKPSVSGLFSSMIYMAFISVGLFIGLDLMHLEKTISSLLAGAGIIGLALGFAFQDLTANFISGLFIIFRKPFENGQIIDTNSFIGTVEDIQLRSTIIRTYQGMYVMIPNKDIFQKALTNYSLSKKRRIDITLNIPVDTDINSIEDTIKQRISNLDGILKDPAPEIYFTDYSVDALKMELRCWVDNSNPVEFSVKKDLLIRSAHETLTTFNSKK
jgi:small conductance mechanosensitive channel